LALYIYDIVSDDEAEKHKVLSKDEIKESKKRKELLDTYKEAIEALKDAEKALERCNAFVVYDYDWLQEKIKGNLNYKGSVLEAALEGGGHEEEEAEEEKVPTKKKAPAKKKAVEEPEVDEDDDDSPWG